MAFFNPFRPSYLQDPYSSLRRLREEEPVFYWREQDGWVLTRHEDCSRVLRDSDAFSSDPSKARGGLGQFVARGRALSPLQGAPLIGAVDAPVHTRLRAIVNRAFTPRVIEGERDVIRQTVATLLERGGDPLDAVQVLTQPLPVTVISDLLGLAPDEREPVRQWAQALMSVHSDPDASSQARRAASEAAMRFRTFLAEYRDKHGPEYDSRLFTILVEAESAGDRLSPEELLAFAVFLYTAGSGPTAMMLGNVITHLVQHPDALDAVRADRSLLRAAIEESLRYDSATHVLLRYCVLERQIGGRTVKPGDTVYVVVAAAHRDPEVFPDPDRFDLHRDIAGGSLLSFGAGPHFCLGAPLAYLEGEEMLNALLDRFPRLSLTREGARIGAGLLLRGPERLMITGR